MVLLLLALGRGASAERLVAESPTLRQLLPSFARAARTTLMQAGTLDGGLSGPAAFARGVGVRFLLLLGFLTAWRTATPARLSRTGALALVALLLSLIATCWVSIAANYRQFGLLCCERHDTLRQTLLALAELTLARLGADVMMRVPTLPARTGLAASALLGAALLWLGVPRLPELHAASALVRRGRAEIFRQERGRVHSNREREQAGPLQALTPTRAVHRTAAFGMDTHLCRQIATC